VDHEAALSGLELAFRSRGAIAGTIGILCIAIAIPILIVAFNSFRASMMPGGPRETRSRSHRLMRLFRSYVLIGAGGMIVVIGILKLTSLDTWFPLLDPAAYACIESQAGEHPCP